jgi:hypothetical protein
MNMVCDCKEFVNNMKKIDTATDVAHFHGYSLGPEFVVFRYCPWCSKLLYDSDGSNVSNIPKTAGRS